MEDNVVKRAQKKIHFLEWTSHRGRGKGEKEELPTVSLNVKFGMLGFGKKTISRLAMDKNWIKLYYEPTKRIIGWTMRQSIPQEEMKNYKLVKLNKTGQFQVFVKGIVDQFIGLKSESYKLEVNTYKDYQSLLDDKTYYYIKIKP